MKRTHRFLVVVSADIPDDTRPQWDDTYDVLRCALQSIALDNVEYLYEEVNVIID